MYYQLKNSKQLKQQITFSNSILKQISDIYPHFIFTKNTNREYTFVNDAIAKVFQEEKNNILGKKIEDFASNVRGDEHIREDDLKVLEEGQSIIEREEKVIDLDGQEIWLQTTKHPIHDDQNNIVGILGIANNITDKKKAELKLIESEERYRKLFNYSFDGLLVINAQGNVVDCNNNFISFLKYPSKEALINKNIHELTDEPCTQEFNDFLLNSNTPIRNEVCNIYDYSGNLISIEYNVTKLLQNGKQHIILTFKDITEKLALKKKEEEIQKVNNELVAQSISDYQKKQLLKNLVYNIKSIIPIIDGKGKQELEKLIRKIGTRVDSKDDFYSFKIKFEKSHPDFFDKILQINPKLTDSDLKLSTYIKLRLSPKDISNVLSIEKKSVEMAKYRLKKKLNLQKNDDLNAFIVNL